MNDLLSENKRLAKSVRNTIQKDQERLEKFSSPKKLSEEKRVELRMRRTQVHAQSRRFYEIWNEFNNSQREFRDKSKKLLVKRCRITNNNLSDEQIETMLDEGNTAVFAKSVLDEERLARQQLTELQDRHDGLIKLEKSIKEVHDMFMDVALLVKDQGEVMDNIFQHVTSAEVDVEKGKGHLQKAQDMQRSARKKKICFFSVLAVIILIVIIVVLSEFGAFDGGGGGGGGGGETKIIYQVHKISRTVS